VTRPSRFIAGMSVLLALASGCGQPAEPPVQQRSVPDAPAATPQEKPAPAEPAAVTAVPHRSAEPAPPMPRPLKRVPKRPVDSWVIFREARDATADATCDAEWLHGNRFRVKTRNIKRMTLDMTRLPEGAPAKGPWIIHVDGRGIELTGFKPKPGYTGHKRDLVCSKNGVWTVDKRTLYRTGG